VNSGDILSVIRVDSQVAGETATVEVTRTSFRGNRLTVALVLPVLADGSGTAIGMVASGGALALSVSFCEFYNNTLNTLHDGSRGGAIFFSSGGGESSATISDSTFTQNRLESVGCGNTCGSVQGGALWVQCSSTGTLCLWVARSKFVDNYSWDDGGAVFQLGSNSSFDTVLFEGNVAEFSNLKTGTGGAVLFDEGG
jgi:hypothetical protein